MLVVVNYGGFAEQYEAWEKAAERFLQELTITRQLSTPVNFIVHTLTDFNDQREKALADLQSWVAAGKLKVREDILTGLENTPKALIGLLAGENVGKRMARVA